MKKICKQFPNYAVNDRGDVFNIRFNRMLVLKPDMHGYLCFGVWKLGKTVRTSIHRCVAMEFIPNPHKKNEVNHKNGIKTDNRIENLEWCTSSENKRHAVNILGKKLGVRKLTEQDADLIRFFSKKGHDRIIANIFKVSKETIRLIRTGARW